MNKPLLISLAMVAVTGAAVVALPARRQHVCTGGLDNTCTACTNCKYCGHCAKRSGVCSVCRDTPAKH